MVFGINFKLCQRFHKKFFVMLMKQIYKKFFHQQRTFANL